MKYYLYCKTYEFYCENEIMEALLLYKFELIKS